MFDVVQIRDLVNLGVLDPLGVLVQSEDDLDGEDHEEDPGEDEDEAKDHERSEEAAICCRTEGEKQRIIRICMLAFYRPPKRNAHQDTFLHRRAANLSPSQISCSVVHPQKFAVPSPGTKFTRSLQNPKPRKSKQNKMFKTRPTHRPATATTARWPRPRPG